MRLLRLVSWPYFRLHKVRTLLTLCGILLGVAVFVGMHTANQSVLFAFYRTVDRIAGATQLQVSAGESGFPEEVLERVQALRDVRVAVPVIEANVQTGIQGQGNLLVLGVDMLGDQSLRDYDLQGEKEDVIEDPLLFLAQPDSLVITRSFAERNGLRVNSPLRMRTMQGEKRFVVRGVMRTGGLSSAFGGNLAIMDVYAAQAVFGRGRTFDRIDLGVREGARVESVQAELRRLLGPGYQVDAPAARAAQFESLSSIYAMTANITSLFALFIGIFIIYNTFAIAVTQRRREIGILRALGATRRQVQRLFLVESAVAGLVGSGLGVLAGIGIARGMAGSIGDMLGEMYGVAQKADEVSADPRLLAFSVAVGVVSSLIAGWMPSRTAARVDPVQALQKGRAQMLTAGENRARRLLASGVVAVCLVCVALRNAGALPFYAGYVLAIVAALLMTPSLTLWLSRALRPLLQRVRPVEGTLAADSLIQAPRRTAGAVAALMLSLSLVVALAGSSQASYGSIRTWMTTHLNPDLFVTSSESVTARAFRFPPELGDELAQVPGVAEVQRVRLLRVPVKGTPVMIVAVELEKLHRRVKPRVVEGEEEAMFRRTAAGEGVIVSENLSLLRDIHLGDTLELEAPGKRLRLPVLGVTTDYSDQQGSIIMDRDFYVRQWGDATVNIFRVYLQPGASSGAVRESMLARFGEQRRLFVLTNEDLRQYVVRLTDQFFGLTYIQILVAVLVAVLGIVNTLTVSITDRRRELGVLQAVGGLRWQIRQTIWMEALCIGAVGLVLGSALGSVTLYYSLEISRRDLAGLRLGYEYPYLTALAMVPVILGAAFVSALGPAEAAVRGSLVEALEYE